METKTEYLEKIENLISSADKFNEMSFRMVLEGLVAKGGEDAEYLLVRFINANDLVLATRINIIRVLGYIQSRHFLIPLKKIIDLEENIHLKREAVISVSKYNDRQALNILNHALANIKNPLLLQTINNEISKIKKNNPLFALLPRFVEGEKNLKNFYVTIDILKRIVSTTDAQMFTSYLACGKELLENGAFEILCFTADITLKKPILTFFQDRFNQVPCIHLPECEELYLLALKLRQYFFRFPALINEELDNLGTQLYLLKDPRIRALFMAIFCRSGQLPALTFVRQVYDSDPDLRQTIIKEYSGNENGVNFLFNLYRTGTTTPELKTMLIDSLLNSNQGIDYFYQNFATIPAEEQAMIVDHLPYGSHFDLSQFINMIFQAEQFNQKENLLAKVCKHYEFSVKEVLFDPAREKEFFFMERQYLETITALFPISALKLLFEKILDGNLSSNKTRKYLQIINDLVPMGLTLAIQDHNFFHELLIKIVMFNNPELNVLFLGLFKHMKTLDTATYKSLSDCMSIFTTLREKNISVKESDEIRKAKKNFTELHFEIRKINEGAKSLEHIFTRPVLDFDLIEDFITKNSMFIAMNIDTLTEIFEKSIGESSAEAMVDWVRVLRRFPLIGARLHATLAQKMRLLQGPVKIELAKLFHSLPENPPKIVITLTTRHITAIIREQCLEIIPEIKVICESVPLEEGDLLLCDAETLKDFILNNTLPAKKLFLLLDNLADFSSFKSYNLKPLIKPFSTYRIIKEILKELYL